MSSVPSRFVGLHSHDGFSVYDGLGLPQEHIDFCIENGLDAWSMTNHGHMNSFGHAWLHTDKMKKAGGKFKLIPGCEMYLHPDLEEWRKDARAAKEDGGGKRRKKKEEEIATPLVAVVDGNDEAVDVGLDTAALTVENEEETKSNKFYNPVNRRHHLVVIPKTSKGLERLFGLVSRSYAEGFYRFPRIDYKMLKEAAQGDFFVSTACIGGPLAWETFQEIQNVEFENLNWRLLNDPSLMERALSRIGETYGRLTDAVGRENLHLEIQFNRLPAQHLANRALIEFARREGLTDKLVVTCDSHYARPEHWKEREIYKKLGRLAFETFNPDSLPKSREDLKCELYPKNAKQVWETYMETRGDAEFYDDVMMKEAVERTWDIAHSTIGDVQPDRSVKLPTYVIPEGKSGIEALTDAVKEGLKKKGLHTNKEYIQRAIYELKVIKDKDFASYFLTMKEILQTAREKMFVGPGRGSAAGSLVCYVLGITDVDPIKYDLLFERFLSPDREGLPDIDTDVENRDLLLELLRGRFGDENIVPISNYNTFKLKSLIRDISRFHDIPLEEVNDALRTVEREVVNNVRKAGDDKNLFVLTFEDSYEYCKAFKDFIDKHPQIGESVRVLFRQNKALGRHAGGVIVSEKIAERMPLIAARGESQTPWVEGMNYKHLEMLGWVKFDLLGLETLRIIRKAIELILQRHHGVKSPTFAEVKEWFDKNMAHEVIDFNDQRVYENVYHEATTRTPGVFQLTSAGAQKLFQKAKPKSIVDIATLTSIYRPGPLAAKVDKLYLEARANPRDIDYKHPLIKQVLEPTFGCIIFQEQLMALCNVVAGFPKSECDKVRKNILKRQGGNPEESMKKANAMKDSFVRGSVSNGVREDIASKLWDDILFFAGYGFNASHAVAYAIDSYYCAWLLTYYEAEWLCAYLESMIGNPESRAEAIAAVKSFGYEVGKVDVNESTNDWTISSSRKAFIPSFSTVKSVGSAAIEEITELRPYIDIKDLFYNPDGSWKHSKFNRKGMEALIKLKGFDSMNIVGPEKFFSSYKHMHHVVIESAEFVRKHSKRDPWVGYKKMVEIATETHGMEEWTKKESALFQRELVGDVDAYSLMSAETKKKLEENDVRAIDHWEILDLYWFMVKGSVEKTTKKGKPYLLLEVAGVDGTAKKMYLWDWDGKTNFEPYTICIGEVDKSDFGFASKLRKMKILG